jgi:hypothetical protein
VYYQGALIEVRVNREKVEIRVISGSPVTVNVYGEKCVIDGTGISVKLQPAA